MLLISCSLSAFAENPYSIEGAIYRVTNQHRGTRQGTGVLIDGGILTNCHVVQPTGVITVTNRKSKRTFFVTGFRQLGDFDACLLSGQFDQYKPVQLHAMIEQGENVWHYGYPRGVEGVGQGVILGMQLLRNGQWVFQSTSFCNPGSSGGPLLNVNGQLVGLNFGVATNKPDFCLSIPIAHLQPYL